MDWSSVLVGFGGVLVGGAISWLTSWQVTSRQWRRERRDEAMGRYLKEAADTYSWWMANQERAVTVMGPGALAAAAFELDIYAPKEVIKAGAALVGAAEMAMATQEWDPLLQPSTESGAAAPDEDRKRAWTAFVSLNIGRSGELLGRYIGAMRKTVGLAESDSYLMECYAADEPPFEIDESADANRSGGAGPAEHLAPGE